MPTRWDAIVVGAGISGLAAAYELARRQRRVLVLEAGGVGAGQSAGLARIFRVAHADPRLCALALEAERGWRRWERELGAGRLLGGEGLVAAGPERAEAQGAAMHAVGAPCAPLDRAAIAARLPVLAHDHPWEVGLWDPLAGSLRIRRTLAALARRVTVRRATVAAVEPSGGVRLDNGTALEAAAVVVCAGLATGPLVAPLGLDVGVEARHHVRLTYRIREPVATACLIAPRPTRCRSARAGASPSACTRRTAGCRSRPPTRPRRRSAGGTGAGCRGRFRAWPASRSPTCAACRSRPIGSGRPATASWRSDRER